MPGLSRSSRSKLRIPFPKPSAWIAFTVVLVALDGVATHAAAQQSDQVRAGPTRRDSAGIEIIEYSSVAIEAVPFLRRADTPDLSIGELDGPQPYLFSDIAAAAQLSDGAIVIVDRVDLGIRYFDERGQHVRSVGRRGEGSGEFQAPDGWWLGQGDTLRIWDPRLMRLTEVSDLGSSVSMRTLMTASPGDYYYLGSYADGSYLFLAWRAVRTADGTRDVRTYKRMSPLGETMWAEDTIFAGSFANERELWQIRPSQAVHPRGMWFSSGVDAQVLLVDTTGARIRIVRWQESSRTVKPEDIEQFIEEQLKDVPPEGAVERRRSLESRANTRFPSVSWIAGQDDGRVWVARFERPGEDLAGEVLVFDRSGNLEARVEGVPWMEPMPVDLSGVLLAESDDQDVPVLRRYRLIPGG